MQRVLQRIIGVWQPYPTLKHRNSVTSGIKQDLNVKYNPLSFAPPFPAHRNRKAVLNHQGDYDGNYLINLDSRRLRCPSANQVAHL